MATTSSRAMAALMGVLAKKLKALLGREYDLQVGVHDDVKSLQSELQFMHAFLLDYSSYQQQTMASTSSAHVNKVWVRKVRELAYDVEDAIDDFTCRVGPAPKEIPDMVKHFVYTLMARHQIAKQLRRLRRQAQELSEQRKRYAPLCTPPPLPPPGSTTGDGERYFETTTNLLVGIDGPRDEFIANLTSAARKHRSGRRRVASMVGIAGVGKTTLAKAVYHSLEDLFQCRAIVNVSRKLDLRRVLKDILQQVMITTGNGSGSSPGIVASMETWEDSQFVDRLRDNLKDKRYLIIVDDLWKISAWDHISRALPDNSLDSMIITTTRKEYVAKACCARYHPGHFVYKVSSLEYPDSRTLFLHRTFDSEDNFPHDLEELSTKIIKKCAGLPLAIVCISSLLATKGQEATEWEKVYDSLGSKSNDGLSCLLQALEVSYDDLPQHLKVCLLYLTAFRKDCEIRRDQLTRRWITEGFVDEKPGMSMQEVAENNFSELIERNMIQEVDVDCFGEIHACTIHGVMFDLISRKSSEENFVTLIRDLHGKSTLTQQQYIRWLSLDYGTTTDDLDMTNFNMTHVRSLTIYGNIGNLDSVPLGRYLRMLDFECCEGVNSRHLKNIGELILLKYLSLKSTWISELPREIGGLKCLETLDLTQTNIKKLPVEVARLQRLVHLLAGGAELPQGIGSMRSLQILCIRVACESSKEAVKELLRLTNLRKLDMTIYVDSKGRRKYEDECVDTLPLIISELSKCKLQSLHLNLLGYSIRMFLRILLTPSLITSPPDRLQNLRIRGEYGFNNVPRWIGLLSHLTDLELTVRNMEEKEDLEIIAKLPRLVRLRLTVKEPSRKGFIILESGFACLKDLFISCRIMPVSFNQGAMPKLEKFELQFRAYQEDSKCTCPSIEHLKYLIKGFQFTIVVGRGLSYREVEHLRSTFKSAVFRVPF